MFRLLQDVLKKGIDNGQSLTLEDAIGYCFALNYRKISILIGLGLDEI